VKLLRVFAQELCKRVRENNNGMADSFFARHSAAKRRSMSLKKIRKNIDLIDHRILTLLNDRAKLSLEVKKFKPGASHEIYVPHREAEILNSLGRKNRGPFPAGSLKSVYREIFSASRALQAPLRIAYWGPEGSFTHLAAQEHFGSSVKFVNSRTISDIFEEIDSGRSDFGVVPIENSTEGAVNYTLDMFVDSPLSICAEIYLKIAHNLLSNESSIKKIKKLFTGLQPLAQSRKWVEEYLPSSEIIEVSTTAEAARLAAKTKGGAAIANTLAAEIYGLGILARNIGDISNNITRFMVIGKRTAERTGSDKTSVLCSIKDKVGALYTMLMPFKKNRINLTSIESRPSRKKAWEYYFFIDMQGHREDKSVKKALAELSDECQYFKILGSYPAEKY